MYGTYLRKKIPLYLISGTACALLLAANVWFMRENSSLAESAEAVRNLQGKKQEILLSTKRLQFLRSDLEKRTPRLTAPQTAKEQLLLAMDRMNAASEGITTTFGDINGGGDELAVPVEAKFTYRGFSSLMETLASFQRMTYPYFRFSSFSFTRGDGTAMCEIRGELVAHAVGGGR